MQEKDGSVLPVLLEVALSAELLYSSLLSFECFVHFWTNIRSHWTRWYTSFNDCSRKGLQNNLLRAKKCGFLKVRFDARQVLQHLDWTFSLHSSVCRLLSSLQNCNDVECASTISFTYFNMYCTDFTSTLGPRGDKVSPFLPRRSTSLSQYILSNRTNSFEVLSKNCCSVPE